MKLKMTRQQLPESFCRVVVLLCGFFFFSPTPLKEPVCQTCKATVTSYTTESTEKLL